MNENNEHWQKVYGYLFPNMEVRQYKHYYHGNGTLTIECPFCQKRFTGYAFSMGGHGKKCPRCGAIHFYKSSDFIALMEVPLLDYDSQSN